MPNASNLAREAVKAADARQGVEIDRPAVASRRWLAPEPIPYETHDTWLRRIVHSLEDYINA